MIKHLIRVILFNLFMFMAFNSYALADVKVLVIPKGAKAFFWTIVGQGALQAGDDLRISVKLRGPANEAHRGAQIKIIEYGISEAYDAIVLAPNHVTMAAQALKKAVAKDIKVVLIDSNMDAQHHQALVESYNYKAGQVAAHHLSQLLGKAGKVVLARHIRNHASTHEREQGFLDTIQSHYPQLKIIADPYIGASLGSAYHSMIGLIDRASAINAIFAVGEESTLGTLKALRERGLEGKIKFVGFDFNAVIKNAILDHEMDASIVQNPFKIGYLGVKTAYQLTRNETVPQRIVVETILVTAENYKTDEVKEVIDTYVATPD